MTKKWRRIMVCIACTSLLLGGCGSNSNKIIKLIEKNNFSEAYETYKDTAKKRKI